MERNGVKRRATVAELVEELRVTEELLKARQGVLDAIPECRAHGRGCVPHALEWIAQAKRAIQHPRKLRRRSS